MPNLINFKSLGGYRRFCSTTVQVGKDGKAKVVNGTDYALRYTRHPLTTWIPEIDSDGWQGKGGFQKGGVYFTTATSGGQDRTKFKSLSKTSKHEVGELMDALSVLARGQGVKGELGLQNSFSDWMSAGSSAADNVKSSSDYFKEEGKNKERDGGANIGGSKAINEDRTPYDTVCNTCGGSDHGFDMTIRNERGDSIGKTKSKVK